MLIDARLRQACGWSDARILDISRRGLMVRAARAPARGSYVEICRGTHRIVARVVWVNQDRAGLRTQDAIAVDAIVKGEDFVSPAAANRDDRRSRRRPGRTAEQQECSRDRARKLQFLGVMLFAVGAGFTAFDTVRDTLSKPLRLVESGLAARP